MNRFAEKILKEKDQYLQKVRQETEKFQEIVIYGAGVYGKNLAKLLKDNGFLPSAFCVSSLTDNRKEEWGIPIRSLEDVLRDNKEYLYLIAAEYPHNMTMLQTLRENEIHSYIDITPHFYQILDPVYFRPIIEITSRVGCGVRCRYCPQDIFIKKYSSSEHSLVTSLENFRTCIDKLPKEVVIDFAGFAEPFFNPAIIDMMEYAQTKGHDLRLYTTLRGLSVKELDRVLKIPFMSVVLHLPDSRQCANIPMTEEYFQLLETCLSAVKQDGQPFVDHANAQCEPPPKILERIKGRVRVGWDMIDWAGNIETQDVRSSDEKKGPLLCAMSARQNHNILLPDGRLLLCCMDWGMKYVLGNLLVESYEAIMQKDIIKNIRREMVDESIRNKDFLCKKCTSAIEMR